MDKKMTTASLRSGDRVLVEIRVPAFPNQPELIHWHGRHFLGGEIGYGPEYLSYHEVTPYEAGGVVKAWSIAKALLSLARQLPNLLRWLQRRR